LQELNAEKTQIKTEKIRAEDRNLISYTREVRTLSKMIKDYR